MTNEFNAPKLLSIFHTILIFIWIVAATIIFGILAISVSFFSKTGDGVHYVARIWGKSILWVSGMGVNSKGVDDHLAQGSYIYMSNHQSNYDIPVLYSALPVQFRWLAKAELFKIPIFGRSMRGAGYISIDRSNRKSAFQSLDQAAGMIRNGTSVMIFPEGTRSTDGQLLPFKKGGFVLAVDAGVPIVPITISGTHEVMPKGRLLIRRRRVTINVGLPIRTSDYTRKTKDELMMRVREAMVNAPSMQDEVGCRG
ncbi:MAG: lysophospholipid acyltransferase family protein [Desulfobacteraceae bacterium]|jgi:1-acyl-sn-glycerol-3-phosphate acyltransferase